MAHSSLRRRLLARRATLPFHTVDSDTAALGSLGIVPGKGKTVIWRFYDGTSEAIDVSKGRR